MSEWFYLPYKLGKYGNAELFTDNGITFLGNPDNRFWMSNSSLCQYGIHGQRAMWHSAKGKVLCCLGMGILPLLCAAKPEVTEVVAIDIDQDIIDAFNAQGFNTSKLTVIKKDMMDIESIDEFDSIFLDAYPVQHDFFEKHKDNLKDKVIVMQGWEWEFAGWLGKEKQGKYSYDSFNEYRQIVKLPAFTKEQVDDYMFTYYGAHSKFDAEKPEANEKWYETVLTFNTPIDQELNEAVKQIHLNRIF